MTTFAHPRTEDAPSGAESRPLSRALERLREVPLEHLPADLRVGEPAGPDWWSRDDLLQERELDRLQAGVAGVAGTDDARVTGTFLLEAYAWQLVAPALALHLTTGHVPDLDARSLRVRIDGGGGGAITGVAYGGGRFATLAGRPEADHPDGVSFSCEEDLIAWFRRSLVTHLDPVIARLATRSRRGPRALWASVEDCCSAPSPGSEPATPRAPERTCSSAERPPSEAARATGPSGTVQTPSWSAIASAAARASAAPTACSAAPVRGPAPLS